MSQTKLRPLARAIPGPGALLYGFPLRDKALFFRQLSTMINAGVALSKSVQTSGSASCPALSREMSQLIDASYTLSQVMGRYPHYFSDYEVAAVRTGECAGRLDDQLELLAEETEKANLLRQTLTSKLFYPILIGHAAIFIPPLAVIVTKGLNAYLRMTLGMLIPIYVISAVAYLLYRLSTQSSGVRGVIDTILYYTPIVGAAVRTLALTRFLRVLSHLHEAGMLPDQALKIAYDTCGNQHLASCIAGTFKRLGDSVPTSVVLERTGVIPKIASTMLATGEETGQTALMLNKVATMLEQDLQVHVHRMVTVLPILMLLGLGVMVGYNVISVFRGLINMIPF